MCCCLAGPYCNFEEAARLASAESALQTDTRSECLALFPAWHQLMVTITLLK